jgi:hypothetical protein
MLAPTLKNYPAPGIPARHLAQPLSASGRLHAAAMGELRHRVWEALHPDMDYYEPSPAHFVAARGQPVPIGSIGWSFTYWLEYYSALEALVADAASSRPHATGAWVRSGPGHLTMMPLQWRRDSNGYGPGPGEPIDGSAAG